MEENVGRPDWAQAIKVMFGVDLWSVPQEIIRSTFIPNARVAVKGCHASGKCVAASEYLTLADGRRVQATELVGQEFSLLTYDVERQAVRPVSANASLNAVEPVFAVETESGRRIVRNAEHPLWVATGVFPAGNRCKITPLGWTHLHALEPGMLVAVPESLPVDGASDMPRGDIKLLAYLIGDGGVTQGSVRFTQLDGVVLDEFSKLADELGAKLVPCHDKITYRVIAKESRRGVRDSNPAISLLRAHGLLKKHSRDKRIPSAIFGLPATSLAIFLSRLYATDGWASVGKHGVPEIGFCSASEGLIRDLQELLLRFGVCGRIAKKPKVNAWSLSISASGDLLAFIEQIGIFGKEAAVERVRVRALEMAATKQRRVWRWKHLPPGLRWERIKSIEAAGAETTVAIEVPETNTFLTTFWEHNTHLVSRAVVAALAAGGDVITCYAEGTEVLTRRGWLPFESVKVGPDGDEFATRNPRTHAFEWQHAHRYYEADWDGEVVDLVSRGHRVLRVTPNHRVLLRWADQKRSGEHLKPAGDIPVGSHNNIPTTSTWDGASPSTVKFGRYEWSSNDFAAFMGMWLAEGSLGGRNAAPARHGQQAGGRGRITITQLPKTKGYEPYREMLTKLIGREPPISNGRNFHFNCQDLWNYLLPLGRSGEKFVPPEIKDWSKEDLETLLHYYWLGDGYAQKPGQAHWKGTRRSTTVSRRLADDMQEIAQKIGKFATITPRAARDAKIDGREIPAERCRLTYEVRYSESQARRVQPERVRYLGKVRCVSVPNEIIYVRTNIGGVSSPVWCGNTAPTGDQVKGVLWQQIEQAVKECRYDTSGWKMNQTGITLPDGAFAMGRSTDQGVRFQGYHARPGSFLLLVVDEAPGVIGEVMGAIEGISAGGDVRLIILGNPLIPSGAFYEVFSSQARGWTRFTINAFNSPNFVSDDDPNRFMTLEELLAMPEIPGGPLDKNVREYLISRRWVYNNYHLWGEQHPWWAGRVLGEFPGQAQGSLLPLDWIEAAADRESFYRKGDAITAGIDVAGEGEDETVVTLVQGDNILEQAVFTDPDSREPVLRYLRPWIPRGLIQVNGDKAGLGLFFIAHLRDQLPSNVNVHGINVGEEPLHDPNERDPETGLPFDQKKRFINQKGQLYWDLRERFREGRINGLVDPVTKAQLASIMYGSDSRGRVVIESKKAMRRRGVKSPDRAESLMLAFSPPPPVDVRTLLYGKSIVEQVASGVATRPGDVQVSPGGPGTDATNDWQKWWGKAISSSM